MKWVRGMYGGGSEFELVPGALSKSGEVLYIGREAVVQSMGYKVDLTPGTIIPSESKMFVAQGGKGPYYFIYYDQLVYV